VRTTRRLGIELSRTRCDWYCLLVLPLCVEGRGVKEKHPVMCSSGRPRREIRSHRHIWHGWGEELGRAKGVSRFGTDDPGESLAKRAEEGSDLKFPGTE